MTKYNSSNGLTSISQEQQQRFLKQINIEEWANAYYPLISQRKEPISSLASAIKDKVSLVDIDNKFGDGFSLQWIKAQLLDTFRLLGAGNSISSLQVIFMARRIRSVYYYLSPSEITYFFEALIGGGYGKVYIGNTINPQNLMEALQKFDNERSSKISELEYKSHKDIKKKEGKPNFALIDEICNRFKKKYIIDHVGCKAPDEYNPFKK